MELFLQLNPNMHTYRERAPSSAVYPITLSPLSQVQPTKEIMKQPHTCETILIAPPKLGLDNNSHTISKIKPKIRVIHIVAPEIIKTDVENFREIVQRLTGKSTPTQGKGKSTKKGNNNESMKKMELPGDVPASQSQSNKHRMKKQISEEMLYGGHNTNGFLGFLGDVDCFINIQEMNEFHLAPFRSSSRINLFGEMHLC